MIPTRSTAWTESTSEGILCRMRTLPICTITVVLLLTACSAPPELLMDTPVIWHSNDVDPFAHLEPADRVNALTVLYATRRRPEHAQATDYGTSQDVRIHLGTTQVSFGRGLVWAELDALSRAPTREIPVELYVDHSHEDGAWAVVHAADSAHTYAGFLEQVRGHLADARDPELLIYVHGAKVDFYRCVARTGEVVHFSGRDIVPIVFDWPTHTNILSYVWGEDRKRAAEAGVDLAHLIELLASHTAARKIHVLAYSAGAKTLATALLELASSTSDPRALRIGTVVFAAADLDRSEFIADLPRMHDLVERLTVTVSDHDEALHSAQFFMGGGVRLGEDAGDILEFVHDLSQYERLEIVDVSWGKEQRGFDITGHHYWHHHPWVTSDLILNLRGDLPAAERGLQVVEHPLWFFPIDYPERAQRAAARLGSGE